MISLINGKIRTENKLCQINNNILNHKDFIDFSLKINFKLNFFLKKTFVKVFKSILSDFYRFKYFLKNLKSEIRFVRSGI